MRRGRPGVAGLKREEDAKKKFEDVGKKIEETQIETLKKQLTSFKENLQLFAAKHKAEINANPQFRAQFQKMCAHIGVDPLASHKGFWSELLGMGDFYYALAVQIIEVCLATRAQNGGLISMHELLRRVSERRGRHAQEITADDIVTAVRRVSALGSGFRLLTLGNPSASGTTSATTPSSSSSTIFTSSLIAPVSAPTSSAHSLTMILSVPCELNRDHMAILELSSRNGSHSGITLLHVVRTLGWPPHRIRAVLDLMMQEGMAWVDMQGEESSYWFPSLCGWIG